MKLKNLMENKQLDFNQPFLSVRRVSSSMETSSKANETERTDSRWPPLPVYKSELKSGPVRNPGNVPFLWEHAPGRPKDGRKSQTSIGFKPPSAAPDRSPGMSSDSKQQHCSQGSPKNKNIVKFRTLRERIERDLSSGSEGDGDETYLEANDTLSRSESFSMNCSVTGLSGLDGGDAKQSGAFSRDRQTHDLMMGRFLPAAKALASESPQVAHRKQSVKRKQQKEAKKMVEMDKEHRVNSLPTALPSHYSPSNPHDDKETSEDDHIDLDESYSSTKACGLFARFCLRGSFCVLHPVPGMRSQDSTAAAAHRVQNDNLTHSSCSSIKDLRNEENLPDGNQIIELRGQLNRKGKSNDRKKQYKSLLSEGKVFPSDPKKVESSKVHNELHRRGRTKFCELLANESSSTSPFVVEKTLHVDSVHNMMHQSSNSSSADTEGITEILHLDSSPQHVQPSNVESKTYKRLSSTSIESMDSCSSYYDAKANSKATNSEVDLVQDAAILAKAVTDERTIDLGSVPVKKLRKFKTYHEALIPVCYNRIENSDQSERAGNLESLGSLHHKKSSQEESSSDGSFRDFVSFTSSEASKHLESKVVPNHDLITLTSSRSTARGKIDLERTCQPKRSLLNSSQLALAPPLPKSPSESWLKRTLPTISARNSTSQSTLAARICATRQNTVF